eukprot:357274-Chlamydomonas_euryale.AAC.18
MPAWPAGSLLPTICCGQGGTGCAKHSGGTFDELLVAFAGSVPGPMLATIVLLLQAHGVVLDRKWDHRRYFHAGLFALSNALLEAQLTRILASPWFSLLCDSSTDIAEKREKSALDNMFLEEFANMTKNISHCLGVMLLWAISSSV